MWKNFLPLDPGPAIEEQRQKEGGPGDERKQEIFKPELILAYLPVQARQTPMGQSYPIAQRFTMDGAKPGKTGQ